MSDIKLDKVSLISIPAVWRERNAEWLSSLSSFYRATYEGREFIVAKHTGEKGDSDRDHPRTQWWVWFESGKFWQSFGRTLTEAVKDAAKERTFP